MSVKSIVLIAEEKDRDALNTALNEAGFGLSEISVPMDADGNIIGRDEDGNLLSTPTHYGFAGWFTEPEVELLIKMIDDKRLDKASLESYPPDVEPNPEVPEPKDHKKMLKRTAGKVKAGEETRKLEKPPKPPKEDGK